MKKKRCRCRDCIKWVRCLTLEAHWLGCTTNASLAMLEKTNMIWPFLNFCILRRHVIFLWLEQEITQFSSMSKIVQQDTTMYSLLYFCKLLYMFRVVTQPIIRSTYNCNYIWHWSNFGKCSVWSQLKMRVMDPTGPYLSSAYTVFTCFVLLSEQTATCATYSINWLVFITEMNSVYCAVQTGSLNKAVCASSLKG
jgi:hypothetical protein